LVGHAGLEAELRPIVRAHRKGQLPREAPELALSSVGGDAFRYLVPFRTIRSNQMYSLGTGCGHRIANWFGLTPAPFPGTGVPLEE
jgi:hypothetical protein